MFSIPKKFLQKSNSESSMKTNDTVYNKIRSYMTIREINENPILASALTQDKKIMFSLLTPNKSKIISIKGIKSDKKQHLVEQINKFRKAYSNYFKNYKYSMDEITTLQKENAYFIKKYHEIEEKSGIGYQDKFEEIKKAYEKKNYNLPTIEGNKNLFGGSLLLSNNETDLKKYIIYGVGSENSNQKSIQYLNKVNQDINEKAQREGKKTKLPLGLIKSVNRRGGVVVPSPLYAYYKISSDNIKEILDYQNDINNLKNTIDSIPEIDYFFDSDNKKYLDSLKFFDSRKSSANFSTGAYLERTSANINSSFCSRKDFNGSNTNTSSIKNISRITYNGDSKNKSRNNNKVTFNPNTMVSFLNKPNNSNNKITLNEIPNLTRIIKKPKKKKRFSVVKSYKNHRKALETLYKQVSTSFDTVPYNKKIEKYLKFRKYDIFPKLAPYNICNNIENIRDQICKGKAMRRVIDLRKNLGDNLSNIDQLNRNEVVTIKSMNEMEDKMIKVFSGFKSN